MTALRTDRRSWLSVAADVEVGALLGGDGGHGVNVHLVVGEYDLAGPGYEECAWL